MQVLDSEGEILALPPEGDESMPLTIKERLEGIEGRLGQVETLLRVRPSTPRSALQRFRKHLWEQIKKYKGTVIPLVAISVGVLGWFVSGWFKYYLEHKYDFVNEMVSTNLNAKGGINDKLGQIQQTVTSTKATLDTLQPFIHDIIQRQFENVAKLRTGALILRIPALENLVAVAKNQKVTVNPNTVTEVGIKLVDASRQNAKVSDAVLRWLEYKSFNNSFFSFLPDTTNEPTFTDRYVINIPESAHPPSILLKGKATADVAAQTGYIGQDRNKGLTFGPAWIVMEGGEVGLDDIEMRNVVFHSVQISYLGRPVSMKNVYFIDCTFNMHVDPKTRQLVIALLAPTPSTSFQSMPGS
jgi:hypothetical protein